MTSAQKKIRSPYFVMSLLALAVAGCAVGPDFKQPDVPKAQSYSIRPAVTTSATPVPFGEAQTFNVTKDVPHDWWTLFQSPKLNALIERALKNNPNIESAQAALRQAQAYASAQQGFFYPTVGASYSPSRTKLAGNVAGGSAPGVQSNGRILSAYQNPAGPVFNAPVLYNFHVAQLTVGYSPDVFGLNRRLLESAEAQVMLQQVQLEAAYLTLVSNVVAAALQEAALRAQLTAMNGVVAANQEMLDGLNQQLKLGYVSEMEVAAQEVALALAQQAILPLKMQLDQTRNLLNTLIGQTPDQVVVEQFELNDFHLPQELPLSLPSKLVEQRPDVRAAEAQLRYASAQAGVAVANRLPQFTLAAGIGGMATTPGWMFKQGGDFFNLAATVAATIFDGGTLKARSEAAAQGALQAGAQYRSTVMLALQNVADTLYTIQSDAEALRAAAQSKQAAQHSMELTKKQYQLGMVSYQVQLQAEQAYQLSVVNFIQAQTNRLGDTATLYQALGGGWWNRQNADGKPVVLSVSGESTR